jgi:hypothetical protein
VGWVGERSARENQRSLGAAKNDQAVTSPPFISEGASLRDKENFSL